MATITLSYTPINGEAKSFELDDDGVIKFIAPSRGSNWYLSFDAMPTSAPTEAQRRAIARIWLGDKSVVTVGPNARVSRWAFEGLRPDDVSRIYGTGAKVYLA